MLNQFDRITQLFLTYCIEVNFSSKLFSCYSAYPAEVRYSIPFSYSAFSKQLGRIVLWPSISLFRLVTVSRQRHIPDLSLEGS